MKPKKLDKSGRAEKRLLYPAVIEKAQEGYGVFFPDLPGCCSAGGSIAEAVDQAHEALALHVAGMTEDGEALPDASEISALGQQPTDVDVVAVVLVGVTPPGPTKAVRIYVDTNLLNEIDARSSNRSEFFTQAARAELSRRRSI